MPTRTLHGLTDCALLRMNVTLCDANVSTTIARSKPASESSPNCWRSCAAEAQSSGRDVYVRRVPSATHTTHKPKDIRDVSLRSTGAELRVQSPHGSASHVRMTMRRDPYHRERERAMIGGRWTAGISLTVFLVVLGVGAVAFVYWRG